MSEENPSTIWKFTLEAADRQVAYMPRGARILSVGEQRGDINVWAIVDPEVPTEARTFLVLGTGHPAAGASGATFLGTVQLLGGSLVFHVFEEVAR